MQRAEPLGNDTFSVQTQQTARKWLEVCRQTHPDCQGRADKGFVPTRLLDVSHEDRFFLVECKTTHIEEPYTTLSYCWGPPLFVTLSWANRKEFMYEGLPMESLPRTIREGVLVTRALGLRYIWVDSLCT